MSQLASIAFHSAPPMLSPELAELVQQSFNEAFEGFSSPVRWLRCGLGHFKLKGGGTEDTIPADRLIAVFLRANSQNHCIWNQKAYAPGQEPEAPDLIWMQNPDYYPPALPAQYREKIARDGGERWGFRIRRRTVWALAQLDHMGNIVNIDFENPVVYDISSSSLFGKSLPDAGQYKWGGLATFCKQHSGNGFVCTPSMFLTRILPDPSATVIGVVNFQPLVNPNTRQLEYLPPDIIETALRTACRDDIVQLAKVTEKLEFGDAMPQSQPQTYAPQPQPQAYAPQPQPINVPPLNFATAPATDADEPIEDVIEQAARPTAPAPQQAAEKTGDAADGAKQVTESSVDALLSFL